MDAAMVECYAVEKSKTVVRDAFEVDRNAFTRDDYAQELRILAWRLGQRLKAGNSVSYDAGDLDSYVYGALWNYLRAQKRTRRRRERWEQLLDYEPVWELWGPCYVDEPRYEASDILEKIKADIPDKDWRVLMAFGLHGGNKAATSEFLGAPVSTFRWMLRRALSRVADAVGEV